MGNIPRAPERKWNHGKKDKHVFLLITLNMRFHLGNTGYLKHGFPLFQKGKWLLQVYLPRLARGGKLLRVTTCRTTYENLPANSKQCARMKWLCHKDIYQNITGLYKTVRPENWVDIILRSMGYLDENIYLLCHATWPSPEKENMWHLLKSYVLGIFWAIRLPPLYLDEVGRKRSRPPTKSTNNTCRNIRQIGGFHE